MKATEHTAKIEGALRESQSAVVRLVDALRQCAPDHPDMTYAWESLRRSREALGICRAKANAEQRRLQKIDAKDE